MDYYDYLIDFERLNELTNPVGYTEHGLNQGAISPVSRRTLMKYVDAWNSFIERADRSYKSERDNKRIEYIINNLRNSGILISPQDQRDNKLNEILDT